jgi:hypothetical protein
MTAAAQWGRGAGGQPWQSAPLSTAPLPGSLPALLPCNRCGFPVSSRAQGCKNPCANCGTVYPLGDCSD